MKLPLTLTCISTSLYALHVGGAINVRSGYRFDAITLKGERFGVVREDKITALKGWQNSIDGTLKLNNFYLRAAGAYQKIFTHPEYYTTLNGIKGLTDFLEKRYGLSALGAFGYLFKLDRGRCYLGPEAGFSYQRLNPDHHAHEIAATPFIGFQFLWSMLCDWSIDLNFDFHFLGARRSAFPTAAVLPFGTVTEGHYYGPEVRLAFDYTITNNWSMGVLSFFKYLKTTQCTLPGRYNATTQVWMNAGASLIAGYTF